MTAHLAAIEPSDRFVSSDVMMQRDFMPQNNDPRFISCINTPEGSSSSNPRQPSATFRPQKHTMNLLTTWRSISSVHDCAECNQLTLLCKPQSSATITNTLYVLASCDDDDVRLVLNLPIRFLSLTFHAQSKRTDKDSQTRFKAPDVCKCKISFHKYLLGVSTATLPPCQILTVRLVQPD